MLRYRLFIILLLCCALARGAASKPDFSRPRTAAADALKNLEKANAKHDDRAAVEAALQLVTAVERIGDDRQAIKGPNPGGLMNVNALPDLLQRQIDLARRPDARSLLYLLKAYATPLLPDQPYDSVRSRVGRCYAEAMQQLGTERYPLGEWRSVVKLDRQSLKVFPTVRDFVAVLPVSAQYVDENARKALVANARNNSVAESYPWFYWTMERLQMQHPYDKNLLVESLDSLFTLHADVPDAQLVLERYAELSAGIDKYKNAQWAKRVRSAAARFPQSPCHANILASVAMAATPRVEITAPRRVAANKAVKIQLDTYSGMKTAGIRVMRDGTVDTVLKADVSQPEFARGKYELEVTLGSPGPYLLEPFFDDVRPDSRNAITLYATTLTPSTVDADGTRAVIVSGSADGSPLGGMKIYAFIPDGKAADVEYIGTTGSDGVLWINTPPALAKKPQSRRNYRSVQLAVVGSGIKAVTPAKLRSMCERENYDLPYYLPGRDRDTAGRLQGAVLTDRALYRPGDRMQWMAVTAEVGSAEGRPARNRTLKAELTDHDGKVIASAEAVTDAWGRAKGEFTLPSALKPGYCRVSVADGKNLLASASAAVSDFKLPAVKVTIDTMAAGRETLVRGHVTTYTGVPVADAKILLNTERVQWWMYDFKTAEVDAEGRTDARGYFEIKLSAPSADARYSRLSCVDVTAVSPEGETGQASWFYFSPRPYSIVRTEEAVDISKPVKLPVRVVDGQGNEVKIPLTWTLETAEGVDCRLNGSTDWSSLPGGNYRLKVSAADSTLAFASVMNIALYDVHNGKMPADAAIFLPSRRFSAPAGSRLTIAYGLPAALTVNEISLVNRLGAEPLVSIENIRAGAGFHDLTLELPDTPGRMQLTLRTVRDGKAETFDIGIEVKDSEAPAMEISSFRDRLQAGGRERWTFKFRADGGDRSFAACVLAYNSALSALDSYRLPGLGHLQRLYGNDAWLAVRLPYSYRTGTTLAAKTDDGTHRWYAAPRFAWLPEYEFVSRRLLAMAPAANSALAESAEDAGVMVEDSAAEKADAAPEAAELVKHYDFRPAEQLQALWQPSLVSDGQGNLTVEFDAPVTNGAWTLHALGWNGRMQSAQLTREFVTARPVMVRSVLPRYLRQGDTATLQAIVSSAMSRTEDVSVVFEVFDPATEKILQRVSRRVELRPDSTATLSATVTAPALTGTIGCRVLAVAGKFTDGEQAAIPVLSSGIAVKDAAFRNLTPAVNQVTFDVPAAGTDRTAWLEYCGNPAANVVKIIDNARVPEPRDAVTASAAVYFHRVLASIQSARDSVRSYEAAVELLGQLQRPEGGWAWGNWSERPSEWITYEVLRNIARSGDSRLDSMAMRALPFVQTCALASYDFAPGPHIDFAEVCAFYPKFRPSTLGAALINRTVKTVEGGWRNSSLEQLPRAALLMEAYGRGRTARDILQSVDQYTVTEADGLVWVPRIRQVDLYARLVAAYARIMPDSPTLAGLQAWLIRRTVATDNFSACRPVRLAEALLPAATAWQGAISAPGIRIGRRAVPVPAASDSAAVRRMTLPDDAAGKILTLTLPSPHPQAWAALCSTATGRADSVPPSDSDRLAVSRRLLRLGVGGATDADSLRLGDAVEMQITVRAVEDLDYVVVTDMLPAGLQPVDQLASYGWRDRLGYCYAPAATEVRFYIDRLPRGTHTLTYRLTAATAGRFATGVAVAESQLDASATAHSGGSTLIIK